MRAHLICISILVATTPLFAQEAIQSILPTTSSEERSSGVLYPSAHFAAPLENSFKPELDTLAFTFGIMLRPEDLTAGNILSIAGNANYQSYAWGVDSTGPTSQFRGMYELGLKIQSPSTTKDSVATINRIHSSDGTVYGYAGLKCGFFGERNKIGVLLTLNPTFQLQNSKQLLTGNFPNFVFFRGKMAISGWTGPFVLSYQASWNVVFGAPGELVEENLDHVWVSSFTFLVRLGLSSYFQIKYAQPQKGFNYTQERLEAGYIQSIDLF